MKYTHYCTEENAEKFFDWLAHRGGVAVWKSRDLSDPSFSMSSPALSKEGTPTQKPHWKVGDVPDLVVTDPKEIEVIQYEEFKRFHVAVRRGSQGFTLKLTDASSEKLRKVLKQAGEGSTYVFDYGMQDAVVFRQKSSVSLAKWMNQKAA